MSVVFLGDNATPPSRGAVRAPFLWYVPCSGTMPSESYAPRPRLYTRLPLGRWGRHLGLSVSEIVPILENRFRAGRATTYTPSLSSAKACAITMRTSRVLTSPHSPVTFDHGHHSAAAGSICFLTNACAAQPDSALRALLLACRLELRHARLRVSKANV